MASDNEDRLFLTTFLAIMGVVAVVAVGSLVLANVITAVSTPNTMSQMRVGMIERRTEPYGVVNTSAEAAKQAAQQVAKAQQGGGGGGAPMSGQEVYSNVCSACHASGALGAPVVGQLAQWKPRIAKGKETLYNHAINGFQAMPAKGGNPSLSDAEVKKAVDYMVAQTK